MAKRGDQFEGGNPVRSQFILIGNPSFRGRSRLKHPAPVRHRPYDHTPIDQEQKHSDATGQRRLRPVFRRGEIIFQVETSEPERFFNQSFAMLVVPVPTIDGQTINPLTRQVPNR